MQQYVAVLVSGERRRLELPAHTGSVANAIDRLDAWIATADGGWVNKQHIVEVRLLPSEPEGDSATENDLRAAAEQLAAEGDRS